MASFKWPPEGSGTTGTVTSVGLADGSTNPIFSISGSPVTTSGTLTLTLNNESANTVLAGPTSGSAAQPTFRALVAADIPSLSGTYFAQGGNAFGTTATLGTTDNNPLNIITNNTAKMTVLANGNVGIGTTTPADLFDVSGTLPTSGNGIGVTITATSPTNSQSGITSTLTMSPSSAPSVSIFPAAMSVLSTTSSANVNTNVNPVGIYTTVSNTGSGNLGTVTGIRSVISNTGSANITSAIGLQTSLTNFAFGQTITGSYGVYISNPNNIATITNNYGLYIANQNAGSTNYAIYSAGGNNYFGGNVGIGTTTPGGPLDVWGASGTSSAFQVNTSSGTGNGIKITTTAAGSGVTLAPISSASNENLTLKSLSGGTLYVGASGAGGVNVINNGQNIIQVSSQGQTITFNPQTQAGATTHYVFNGAADTGLNATANVPAVNFFLGQTRQHNTGAITLQEDFVISPSTHSFVGASTITDAAAFAVVGPPNAGTNATITNASTIYVPTAAVSSGVTNSYALNVKAATGATNNYAAIFNGGFVGIGTTAPSTLFHINSASSPALRLVDGTQSNGYVLTSDANGNASWQAAAGSSGANTTLSNLGTTAVNASLIPGTTGLTLGNSTTAWNSIYVNTILSDQVTVNPASIQMNGTSHHAQLMDNSGQIALRWSGNRELFDNSGNVSADWNGRTLYYTDGSTPMFSWTSAGILNAETNQISNVVDPTHAQDAATDNWVTTNFVAKTAIKAPTIQRFTSGSGTYTAPTSPAPLYLHVVMVGGGGGGGGTTGAGGTGGTTTFGTSLLTANGGTGGAGSSGGASLGGTGGTVTSNGNGIAIPGGNGQAASPGLSSFGPNGGCGGTNAFGCAGVGGQQNTNNGSAGGTNTGAGGGGSGGDTAVVPSAGGGGAGGYISTIITSPSATYAYAVGAAGAAGTSNASYVAYAGGSGYIQVQEFYQ